MSELKYRKAFDTLKSEILSGKYVARKSFPSIVATCARFKISRLTAVKAFEKLKGEGLISSRVGAGTFVTRCSKSRLIGLVIPGVAYSSEFFQPIIAELVSLAKTRGYTIIMDGVWTSKSADNEHEAVEVAARLIGRHVQGVIYQPFVYAGNSEALNRRILSAFSRAGIAVLLLDGDIVRNPERSDYDLVSIDNVTAGGVLAAHLKERGARNICFLMRPNCGENVRNRAKGVRNEVLANGLRWSPKNVVTVDPSDVSSVGKLMKSKPRPDAVVCENDVLAAKLMKTLAGLGFRVPDDALIAGFDDVQVARLSSPGITTIRQPCDGLAQAAFDRLVARMSDRALPPVHILLSHKLVIRGSSEKLLRKSGKSTNVAYRRKTDRHHAGLDPANVA